jgi:hypothetical protein
LPFEFPLKLSGNIFRCVGIRISKHYAKPKNVAIAKKAYIKSALFIFEAIIKVKFNVFFAYNDSFSDTFRLIFIQRDFCVLIIDNAKNQ